MNKKIVVLFLSIVFSALVHANEPHKILVLGDSISAAYGMDVSKGWVALLQTRFEQLNIPYQLINASVSGNTTGDGLNRLPALLKKYQPRWVLIELGGNDGLRGYPVKVVRKNLTTMIGLSREKGAMVILAGMEIPPNYGQRYTEQFRLVYQQVSDSQSLPLIPFILEGVATNAASMQRDGIHPTAEAQGLIVENVLAYLKPLLADAE